MSRGYAMTVERVDDGVLCTLDTGGFIFFDNIAFATTVANAILRVSLFENSGRVHIDNDCQAHVLPEETVEVLDAPAPADDFDEHGTGEPPC